MSNSNLDDCMSDVLDPSELNDLPFDEDRFQENQRRLLLTTTPAYKQAEELRRERSKPRSHTPVDFNRVWCPVYSKVRPEWLCSSEHGDYHEPMDEDWSSDED